MARNGMSGRNVCLAIFEYYALRVKLIILNKNEF